MPANLPPEYYKAEKWFRSADTDEERVLALEHMLRVTPKHKGTDHLRADLRKKLSKIKEAPRKKAGKQVDIFHIPRTGGGQVVLLGVPNSGKSSIVSALTNAKVSPADYPFATNVPVPGMVEFEDIQIQLVDMPPVSSEFVMPGQVGTYRNCDLIGIVIDMSEPIGEQMEICVDFLESRKLLMDDETGSSDEQGNIMGRPGFIICTKSDIARAGAMDELKTFCNRRFEIVTVSAESKEGMEALPAALFRLLNIIRVYAKPPGKDADLDEPFTLPCGSTVMDLARDIHRELAEKLKSARIWGEGVYDGQNVQKTHVLHDKDIVELHFG